jgi:putative DNA primase/helicase
VSDLRNLARALGGEVSGAQVLAPGPGHSPRDRSLSVKLSASSPDGFIVHSFARRDAWRECRDHVAARLGRPRNNGPRRALDACRQPRDELGRDDNDRANRVANALALWAASVEPRGTIVESYLASRGLLVNDEIAGHVLRWNPGAQAMVALFRTIATDEPQAVSRTYLDAQGRKLGRKFLGPVGGAAIKLDADENVLGGLHIGEGIETAMAARQLGLKPTWALGSKGAIGAFPVLSGIECLTILTEPDAEREIDACATSWHMAGRKVLINRPIGGKDLNDALRGAT